MLISDVHLEIVLPRGSKGAVRTQKGAIASLGRRTIMAEVSRQMFLLSEIDLAVETLVVGTPIVLGPVLGEFLELHQGGLVIENRTQNGRVMTVLMDEGLIEVAQI